MNRTTRLLALGTVALASLLSHGRAQEDGAPAAPQEPGPDEFLGPPEFAQFGAGEHLPLEIGLPPTGVVSLLDEANTPGQNNAAAWPRLAAMQDGGHTEWTFRCDLRLRAGGDGAGVAFLHTGAFGDRGPAPFTPTWVEPNFAKSFAVGLDVHNPPNEEPFGPWGNYQKLPQREVSLHVDGREIVKRVAPAEFRSDRLAEGAGEDGFVPLEVRMQHVVGGAEVTVSIAGEAVYDRYFLPHVHAYPFRPAIGATTRADASTRCDVRAPQLTLGEPAPRTRNPIHVEVFHHVMTDTKRQHFEKTVTLPPADWEIGRVILTLDIHDGGELWDEWDRNGEVSIFVPDPDGKPGEDGTPAERKVGIVPFITSYRTPCHWKVDVTHFRPWLTGIVRFEVRAGTNFYKGRGYLMSVALDFHHGAPELLPHRITPLWVGTAHHGKEENHFRDFFTDRAVTIDPATTAARVFTTTTGHSQIGEFTPSRRVVHFDPDVEKDGPEASFENVLWKPDVYLNPNRPQFGTWKYSRAGWAPGDVVHPWWIDVTPHMAPGRPARLRYEPFPYAAEHLRPETKPGEIAAASHVVRAYLIEYRPATGLVPAPSLRVTNVGGGSNAAKLGVQPGDYLVRYGTTRLTRIEDLRAASQAAQEAGVASTQVEVLRDGKTLLFDFPPGKLGVGLAQE